MNSNRSLLVTAVLFLVFTMAYCQLTFSPYWGKRSSSEGFPGFDTHKTNCKNSNDILMDIFRYIQMQAQYYMDCGHKSE